MMGVLSVQGPSMSDVRLLIPELILVGAALSLLLVARRIRRSPVAAVVTVLAAVAAGVTSCWILEDSSVTGFGGMIVVDGYSQFFKVLIAAILIVIALVSKRSIDAEGVPHGEYYTLLMLAATGMMFAVSAVDLLTLYLGLELMTLCAYVLVGIAVARPASNEAAIKYFLLGSFASALLLFGISLTYGVTGATDFETIKSVLEATGPGSNLLLLVAIGLVASGLAFKVAAVPFHAWAPDAYQGSITPVAAFLAAGSKAAGLAVLGRVSLVAFGSEGEFLSVILVVLAGLSIVVGSILALSQTDMRRLLAYSSISHAGYALLGLVGGTAAGVSATMTYAFFYVFMTLGAFTVVDALGERGETLDSFQGLSAQRPWAAGAMLLFLLSLTGIPPTAGFVAKFVVIESVVDAGHIELAVLAVLSSVISAFIYMRIAVIMYMKEPLEAAPARFSVAVSLALLLVALITLFGGVLPQGLSNWAVSP